MKTRLGVPFQKNSSRLAWLLAVVVVLFTSALVPASSLFAQQLDQRVPFAILGGLMLFFVFFALVIYVYVALALQTIANKTNTENAWFAWIPILNLILILAIAKKPIWWIVLFLIPIANIVVGILTWMAVAEARGKPNWWGILMIIPVVGLIVPGYLAWSD